MKLEPEEHLAGSVVDLSAAEDQGQYYLLDPLICLAEIPREASSFEIAGADPSFVLGFPWVVQASCLVAFLVDKEVVQVVKQHVQGAFDGNPVDEAFAKILGPSASLPHQAVVEDAAGTAFVAQTDLVASVLENEQHKVLAFVDCAVAVVAAVVVDLFWLSKLLSSCRFFPNIHLLKKYYHIYIAPHLEVIFQG